MITDAEIAAARAVPIADVVAAVLPLKRDFGLCPFHDERRPSFHVHRASNTFCCFGCGAKGDAIEFVRLTKRVDFPTAVRELSGNLEWRSGGRLGAAKSQPIQQKAPRETEVPSLVLDLWRTATAPRLAQFYLESRGIGQKVLPDALRGHEAVWCKEVQRRRPALIAAVTAPDGALCAIQRTWIESRLEFDGEISYERGSRCTDLSAGKKCLGPLGSGAVKLAAAGEVIGIAEGVESALAAAKLFRLPVWATCGSQRLDQIEFPEVVKHIVIFGDNDPLRPHKVTGRPYSPGRDAAAKAESAYRRRGYSCQVEMPEMDWAGMLL